MLSVTGARWELREVDETHAIRLAQTLRLPRVAARVLAGRTVPGDDGRTSQLLAPSFEHLHDPFAMLHMEAAVDRLRHVVAKRGRVRIITDYDVDGTTSSLILQAALRLLDPSVDVSYHIPNRFGEGYGFSQQAALRAADDKVDLVVTADIGVRDHAAVELARSRGLDVLICDHHLPAGASVPEDATVLCPPQAGDSYPNRSLAACGVSLKLAQALLRTHPKRDAVIQSLLKLAAVGTVADMVSLATLENRAIVTLGLEALNRGPHNAGLAALLQVSRLGEGEMKALDLGFRLGPRINAAGRVADASLVIELLNCRDPTRAHELAATLDGLNTERRDIQKRLVEESLTRLEGNTDPFVLLSGREEEGWHRGVVGIVAARVKDELNRPTAVVSIQGDYAVGSIRSVPAVHAVHALDEAASMLVKYGGHPAAAGFTVRTVDLPALHAILCAHVDSSLPEHQRGVVREVDADVDPTEIDDALQFALARLGPFGNGNPEPLLRLPGARVFGVELRGNGKLLKARVPTGRGSIEAVWWGHSEHMAALSQGPVDLLGHLREHRWNGARRLQFELIDARLSQSPVQS